MSRLKRRLVTSLALNFHHRRTEAGRHSRTETECDAAAIGQENANQLTQSEIPPTSRPNVGEHESHQP